MARQSSHKRNNNDIHEDDARKLVRPHVWNCSFWKELLGEQAGLPRGKDRYQPRQKTYRHAVI